MGGLTDAFFGSSPSAQSTSYSTINPQQNDLLNFVSQLLTSGNAAPGTQPYTGELTAPMQPILSTDFSGILQNLLGLTTGSGPASTTLNNASGALNNILTGNQITPEQEAQYFQTSVAAPLEKTFQQQTLPSIEGFFGRSAGGTQGSDYSKTVANATGQLNDTLAQQATNLAFNTQQQNFANQLSAAQLSPGVASAGLNQLLSVLGAGTQQQNVAQQGLTNQYSEFQRQQGQTQSYIQDFIQAALGGTQGNNLVGLPGSTGLLPSFVGSTGGSLGLASLLGLL